MKRKVNLIKRKVNLISAMFLNMVKHVSKALILPARRRLIKVSLETEVQSQGAHGSPVAHAFQKAVPEDKRSSCCFISLVLQACPQAKS